MSQYDVKDFFYRLSLPANLRPYFGLPPVTREHIQHLLPVAALADIPDDFSSLYPVSCVLPMGFSLAFYLAQESLRCCVARALPGMRFLADHAPAPDLSGPGPIAMVYADNGLHLGIDRDRVDQERRLVASHLDSIGLETHEISEASVFTQSLGVIIDGERGEISATAMRMIKLRNGLVPLIRGRATTGAELEHVLGHVLVIALLYRPSLFTRMLIFEVVTLDGSHCGRRCAPS